MNIPSPNPHFDDQGVRMRVMDPLGVLLSKGDVICFSFEPLWGSLSEVQDISEGLPLGLPSIPFHSFLTCAS